MKCTKCKGRGWINNPRFCGKDIDCTSPTITCKRCGGTGYIIGNIHDVIERLESAANGDTINQKEAKQMLESIKVSSEIDNSDCINK